MIDQNLITNKFAFQEFIRVLVPEANADNLKFDVEKKKSKIIIKIKKGDFFHKFLYTNYEKIIPELESVLIKTSLLKLYNKDYPWGSIIGVRPMKKFRNLLKNGCNENEIGEIFEKVYLVKKEKINLLFDIYKSSNKYINNKLTNIYINIPYCKTKCTYCSFASYTKTGKYLEKYNNYIKTLKKEIKEINKLIEKNEIKIDSLYIGGGTPSILELGEINEILEEVFSCKYIRNAKEKTFEAGRIDTLNEKKLKLLKAKGINRISLNPQSFNSETNKKINRYFDEKEFEDIYNISKSLGFIINMDMIIGLPGEKTNDILNSLEKIKKFSPDNFTIHILAIKRASNLKNTPILKNNLYEKEILNKINEVSETIGTKPYYMYRQKNSFDWGENIGFSKEGKESIFNINTIEEIQSTIAIGAGGITKIINNKDIIRINNPKDPNVYMMEIDERLKNKIEKLKKIYKKND